MDELTSTLNKPDTHAFAGCTGRGVRIAVIDSGVNANHPHVNGVQGGIAIGGEIDSYVDTLGHGTAVLAAIKEKAPDAEYYAVKVYYRSLRTNMDSLAMAFRWAIDHKMDVINLSLGTFNTSHSAEIAALVEMAKESATEVVAAAEVDATSVLPGSIDGVIGVGVDWNCSRDSFYFDAGNPQPLWRASGYPRALPGVSPRRNLYGVSFAVANMSGFVARACQMAKACSDTTVDRILHQAATPTS